MNVDKCVDIVHEARSWLLAYSLEWVGPGHWKLTQPPYCTHVAVLGEGVVVYGNSGWCFFNVCGGEPEKIIHYMASLPLKDVIERAGETSMVEPEDEDEELEIWERGEPRLNTLSRGKTETTVVLNPLYTRIAGPEEDDFIYPTIEAFNNEIKNDQEDIGDALKDVHKNLARAEFGLPSVYGSFVHDDLEFGFEPKFPPIRVLFSIATVSRLSELL